MDQMKKSFKPDRFKKAAGWALAFGLLLALNSCAVSLYNYPATARMFDSQSSFPALRPQEVYFFLSKDAFPPDLQSVPVGTLLTPWNNQWSYQDLVREFLKKAAEIGANAVVFDRVQRSKMDYGFLSYSGQATAYRLYKQDPSEEVDLSSSQYGTQTPDPSRVK